MSDKNYMQNEVQTSKFSRKCKDKSIYALASATAVSFMGIGLVDPILPSISKALNASPTQAMLLFTSYLVITASAMFFTFWISTKFGVKKTLVLGLIIVVLFSAASSLSSTVNQIIGWRAIWGLGNALFISTALSAIVNASKGHIEGAITLYESSIGVGMAIGPLAGGLLGSFSWRAPFAGTSLLMLIAAIAIFFVYKDNKETKKASQESNQVPSCLASFRALKDKGLNILAKIAFFYNMTFFFVLAYSPFSIEVAAEKSGLKFGAIELGLVFFAWGILLAVSSVWIAPFLSHRIGLFTTVKIAFGMSIVLMCGFVFFIHSLTMLIICLVATGASFGLLNTTLTEAVMRIYSAPRSIISSAYSGIRFFGGAISSAIAGPLAKATLPQAPYFLGLICVICAITLLFYAHSSLAES